MSGRLQGAVWAHDANLPVFLTAIQVLGLGAWLTAASDVGGHGWEGSGEPGAPGGTLGHVRMSWACAQALGPGSHISLGPAFSRSDSESSSFCRAGSCHGDIPNIAAADH